MKVVVLAGGRGTRLSEVGDLIQKAALSFQGVPLVNRSL